VFSRRVGYIQLYTDSGAAAPQALQRLGERTLTSVFMYGGGLRVRRRRRRRWREVFEGRDEVQLREGLYYIKVVASSSSSFRHSSKAAYENIISVRSKWIRTDSIQLQPFYNSRRV